MAAGYLLQHAIKSGALCLSVHIHSLTAWVALCGLRAVSLIAKGLCTGHYLE